MTSPDPCAVSLDELDQVHVDDEQQVRTQSPSGPCVDAGRWGGALMSAHAARVGGGGGTSRATATERGHVRRRASW